MIINKQDTPSEMITKILDLEMKHYDNDGKNLDEWEQILIKTLTQEDALKMLPEMKSRYEQMFEKDGMNADYSIEMFSADAYDVIETIANKK